MDDAAQVVNNGVRFTLQWAGDAAPGVPVAIEVMLEANKDDEDLCQWLRAAPPDGCLITGGGSAKVCWIRRAS